MTYFNLTFKDDLDLDMLPLDILVYFRYTCMQSMKFLSVINWKLLIWPIYVTFDF